jgi:hypothetical protein
LLRRCAPRNDGDGSSLSHHSLILVTSGGTGLGKAMAERFLGPGG